VSKLLVLATVSHYILIPLSHLPDNDGCYNEDEQHRSTTRKHIPWDEIDEQRLRVYKEEGKAWKWIFKKFPARTEPAIRMRWTMIQQRAK
jgi:hypothetical protein